MSARPPAPSPPPLAFQGLLWDYTFDGWPSRTLVHIALPWGELGPAIRRYGRAPDLATREEAWKHGELPPVMMLPTEPARHPKTADDCMGEAAARFLVAGFAGGTLRMTPGLAVILDELRETIDGLPIALPIGAP